MGYKSVKALREVPSQAHPQEKAAARRTRLGHVQTGQNTSLRGFLGDMFLGKPAWALGFEEHEYEGWVLFFPIPTTTLGQAAMNQTLNSHQASLLGLVCFSSSLFGSPLGPTQL